MYLSDTSSVTLYEDVILRLDEEDYFNITVRSVNLYGHVGPPSKPVSLRVDKGSPAFVMFFGYNFINSIDSFKFMLYRHFASKAVLVHVEKR